MRWRISIPAAIAGRILGMGDIVALVEKAAASIDREQAMRAAERMRKGQFDLNDMREQLAGMAKMGGMSGLMAHAAGRRQDQEPARRAQSSTTACSSARWRSSTR